MFMIRELSAEQVRVQARALAEVLLDCVDGGASVSFMSDLSLRAAEQFFEETAAAVEKSNRIVLAAFLNGNLEGTVQVITGMPPNQLHRADIAKLLVRRAARGKGLGTALMARAEEAGRAAGKTLLVLDTTTGSDAERLYLRLGWIKCGVIPNYSRLPDGRLCGTTIFWKEL